MVRVLEGAREALWCIRAVEEPKETAAHNATATAAGFTAYRQPQASATTPRQPLGPPRRRRRRAVSSADGAGVDRDGRDGDRRDGGDHHGTVALEHRVDV